MQKLWILDDMVFCVRRLHPVKEICPTSDFAESPGGTLDVFTERKCLSRHEGILYMNISSRHSMNY